MQKTRQHRGVRWLALGVAALGCVLILSCSRKPAPPAGSTLLRGTGATFPAVLYHEWFEAFNAKHAGVHVEYKPVGSSGGVTAFLKADTDASIEFGASDNGLTESEVKQVSRGVLQVPVAGGLIALVYNLPGVDNLKLSRAAYTGIFLGTVTRWDDELIAATNSGVKLPSRAIQPIVRLDGSGTTFLFTNHLSAISPAWKQQYGARRQIGWPTSFIQKSGNEYVGGTVALTTGAIGYVDLGTVTSTNLRAAVLENRQGKYVEATGNHAMLALQGLKGVVDRPVFLPDPAGADDYPIVGFTYVMVYRKYDDPSKLPALKKLLRWCLEDEGQDFTGRLGYVRLPTNLATEAIEAVEKLGS